MITPAEQMRIWRIASGCTQEQWGVRLGLSERQVRRLECGHSKPGKAIRALAASEARPAPPQSSAEARAAPEP